MPDREFTWRTHRIAVDFDGCLVENEYPEIGAPIWEVVNEAKRLQSDGACLILWTCRDGDLLQKAVDHCRDVLGLEFDAVNENPPFFVDLWKNDCRKVGADEYWDDRAVFMGSQKQWRCVRGISIFPKRRVMLRKFIDQVLRPEIINASNRGDQSMAMILRESMDFLEQMNDLLDQALKAVRGPTNG